MSRVLVAVLAGGLAVRMLAFATLMRAEDVFAWLTPGAQLGIAAGAGAAAMGGARPLAGVPAAAVEHRERGGAGEAEHRREEDGLFHFSFVWLIVGLNF